MKEPKVGMLFENSFTPQTRARWGAALLACGLAWFGAGPASAQTTDSLTALSASPNPACSGQLVIFTATVTGNPPGTGTPTGTVDFKEGATVLDTELLDGSGQANFSTSTLAAGSHSIT